MKISIVTIGYNCEACIGQTIESVLGQSAWKACSDLQVEYLIIDGASKDQTAAVARSYTQAFQALGVEYRVYSEPDQGIYDAMNKGVRLATGDVIGILNSGDWYEPCTLEVVCDMFQKTDCDLMFGDIRMHKENGATFIKTAKQRKFQTSRDWNHPTTFVKAGLIKENPFPKLGIHDDYGFYLKMQALGVKIMTVSKVLANFRMGGASNHKNIKAAIRRIKDRYYYCYRINGFSRWYLLECIAIEAAKMILG